MRTVALILLLGALSGCAATQDCHYFCAQKCRTFEAWYCCPEARCNGGCLSDYAKGWRSGYYSVATGSDGQVPPVPPVKYWMATLQSPCGEDRIQGWFAGYEDGVASANKDAAGEWNRIPVSPRLAMRPPMMPVPPIDGYGATAPPAKPSVEVSSSGDVLPPEPSALDDDDEEDGALTEASYSQSRGRPTATRKVPHAR